MTEERILDFLDGNLSAHEEEELLHRLAVSPERRTLLKQHLQVRELTSSLARRQFVQVPKMVTASLFTTLAASGYAGPQMPSSSEEELVANLERNIDRTAASIARPLASRRSPLFIASITSFLIGAASVYFLMPKTAETIAAVSQTAILHPLENPTIQTGLSSSNRSYTTYKSHRTYKTYDKDNASSSETTSAVAEPLAAIVPSEAKSLQIIPPKTSDIGTAAKNPFDRFYASSVTDRSFLQRLRFSLRSGQGKAPGSEQALSGALTELRCSYDINDWLTAKVSLGRFSPYEIEAISAKPGFNTDGIPLLQLSSVVKYRLTAGAELGAKWQMFGAPFEFDGGFISDLQGTIIPRGGFFTTLEVNDNIDVNFGLEGMLYTHDIRSSILAAELNFPGQHPLLISASKDKELTGFIGPAVELLWHF